MRVVLLPMMILFAGPTQADERTEARLGPDSKTVPNLAEASAARSPAKERLSFPGSWSGAYEADSGIQGAPGITRYNDAFRQRFRSGLLWQKGALKAGLSVSIYDYDGISSSDFESSQTTPVALRHAYLEWRSPIGLWRLGATEPHWGLGLIAGGRNAYEGLTHDFGFRTPSDTTAGLTYGLKVGKLRAGISGAFVLQDENADLLAGDRGRQGVAVLRYAPNKTNWIGMYGAYRSQEDADGAFLRALALDLAGSVEGALGAADRWRLAFEVAHLLGSTDRLLSETAFAQGRSDMDLEAMGAAAVLGFDLLNRSLAIELEGGYASADRNPEDELLSRFSFDRNYSVGMILIPGLMRHSAEAAVLRASDPSRVGQAPRGVERLKTEGRVAGVSYFNPRISWYKKAKSRRIGVHLGLLIAGLPDGSADAYMSFRRGGPTNAFGGDSAHLLGYEANLGLTLSLKLQRRYALRLSLEGAAALPGEAMFDADGASQPNLYALRTGFTLRAKEEEAR